MSARGPQGRLCRAPAARLAVASLALAAALGPAGASVRGRSITVTDNLRRTVTVPVPASRVLSLQPEMTRIIVALGAGETLVGLDYFLRDNDRLFPLVFPAARSLPVVSKPDESVNRELVVRLRPDVIFASPTEQQVPDAIERSLGIPVVALASMGRFDGLLEEIGIAGKITGRTGRAADLAAYFRKKVRDVAEAIDLVPAAAKPRVYLAFWSSLIRTPVSYEPVERAGGRNVADGLLPSYLGTIGAVVNIEQIIRWDPDIILVQGSFPPKDRLVTVRGVLEDPRLRSVKAVRERRVYYTFGFWYWWDPACVLVETLYLAELFHPASFPDLNIEAQGDAVFREFYDTPDTFTALTRVLDFHDWTIR